MGEKANYRFIRRNGVILYYAKIDAERTKSCCLVALLIAMVYLIYMAAEYHESQNHKTVTAINLEYVVNTSSIKIRKDEILIADGAPHFLELNRMDHSVCMQDPDEDYFMGHLVFEDSMVYLPVQVDGGEFKNYLLCFANHTHHHTFHLQVLQQRRSEGDCDLYISSSVSYPSPISWDWKAADIGLDSIKVYSFARKFRDKNWNALFIGVTGKHAHNKCTLGVEVSSISDEDMLLRLPALRGLVTGID